MDDDLDPKDKEGEIDEDFDDSVVLGGKKSKGGDDDTESLDDLADAELGEDDDLFADEDLW